MRFKALTYLLLAGVSCWGFVSCEDIEDASGYGYDSGRVAVVFAPQTGSVVGSILPSRAVDQNWTAGDRVGISMAPAGMVLPAGSTFSQYQVSGAGTTVSLKPASEDQTLYYPGDYSRVQFVAFSPYTTVSNNTVTYSTYADQSTQAKMEAVDFLYHKGTSTYGLASAAVALPFYHQLSKLVITITTSGGNDAVTLPSVNVQIGGTPETVTANLAGLAGGANNTAALTPGDATTITPYHTNGTGTRTATAIIVPHAPRAGRIITFSADEGQFTYTFPDDYRFEAGKVHRLNLTLTRQPEETYTPAHASNAYILPPTGQTLYIPVSRANAHAPGAIGAADVLTAEFIWADAPGLLTTLKPLGTGADGVIKVTSNTAGRSGNALIAVKVRGEIKWSWHIWVTGYAPNPAQNGGWMDRNLGATSATSSATEAERVKTFGLLYQWGRKDPFPGSAKDANASNEGIGAEPTVYTSLNDMAGKPYAIRYITPETPRAYASAVATPADFIGAWSTTSTNDDYWGARSAGKTIYDPCPEGYRVPPSNAWGTAANWSELLWTNQGRDTGAAYGGWYPAAGGRLIERNAALYGPGWTLFYWSNAAGTNSKEAQAMIGSSRTLTEEDAIIMADNRCQGLSVRCLGRN